MRNIKLSVFVLLLLSIQSVTAVVSVSSVFTSNMVIQQEMLAPLWGTGSVNENIEVTASWGQVVTVKAGTDGKWRTKIQTPKAISGEAPQYTLTFKGATNTVVLSNVLVGDVWLCSGQSNMEYAMTPGLPYTRGVANYETEIAAANYPNIRLFKVDRNAQSAPAVTCPGSWLVCNPTNIPNMSGVAYYFGRELYKNKDINIPIGLLMTYYGGSTCEAWTKKEVLIADTELKAKFIDPYDATFTGVSTANKPTWLYNGMVAPLVSYGIKGALWYQGESNMATTSIYAKLCKAMVQDWRTSWGQGNFPFYYVQLPAYGSSTWPAFRDMQTTLLTIPNSGMAVTIDIVDTEPTNIHPMNKLEVGQRLALWAMAKTYHQNVVFSGPLYKSKTIVGNKIIISFQDATLGTGLKSKNGLALTNFQIAGSNNAYYNATAIINGKTVEVSSSSVPAPTNVAFANVSGACPNLVNNEGLPASPFKTDTWNNDVLIDGNISAVETVGAEVSLKIYPNPVADKLIIDSKSPIKTCDIFDITGKKVLSSISNNDLSLVINTNALRDGIYFLKLKQIDSDMISCKFVKM